MSGHGQGRIHQGSREEGSVVRMLLQRHFQTRFSHEGGPNQDMPVGGNRNFGIGLCTGLVDWKVAVRA